MQRICVFCGSQPGNDMLYQQAATRLGRLLVQRGYTLVYGGGRRGLMGVIAETVLQDGGEVIGVVPQTTMDRGRAHTGVTQLYVEANIQARKARMAALADAFIAMPGGYGTLEELFEAITWAQLGIHHKPIGLLNVAGYFDTLLTFIDQAIVAGFIRPEDQHLVVHTDQPDALLDRLAQHRF